jgi:hypothetical protein
MKSGLPVLVARFFIFFLGTISGGVPVGLLTAVGSFILFDQMNMLIFIISDV